MNTSFSLYILTILLVMSSLVLAEDRPIPVTKPKAELHAYPVIIPDGSLIVMRKGKSIGAVVISNQQRNPEGCDYKWYYRSDGVYDFTDIAKYTSGEVKNTKWIKFGVFNCEWSSSRKSRGFVYFETGLRDLGKIKDDLWLGLVVNPNLEVFRSNLWGLILISKNTENMRINSALK